MKLAVRSLALALSLVFAGLSAAEARPMHHHGHHGHGGGGDDAALAAVGVIGAVIVGSIIAGALADDEPAPRPLHRSPPPDWGGEDPAWGDADRPADDAGAPPSDDEG